MKTVRFLSTIIFFNLILLIFPLNAQEEKNTDAEVKPALLVIDIQNEYLKYMSDDDKKLGMEVINGAIWTFHQMKLPVICVYHTDLKGGLEPGTEPFEYPKSVIVSEDDPKVIKNFPSAFTKTELDKILKEKGCNTLFLCGLSAVACVLATYYGAIDRDYKVFMIKNGIISHNPSYTNVIRDITESINLDTMRFILEKSVKK